MTVIHVRPFDAACPVRVLESDVAEIYTYVDDTQHHTTSVISGAQAALLRQFRIGKQRVDVGLFTGHDRCRLYQFRHLDAGHVLKLRHRLQLCYRHVRRDETQSAKRFLHAYAQSAQCAQVRRVGQINET